MKHPEMRQPGADYIAMIPRLYGSDERFLSFAKVSSRTLARWRKTGSVPGPVRAMILAHEKCAKNKVPFS